MKKITSFLVVFLLALLVANLKANNDFIIDIPDANMPEVQTPKAKSKYRVYIFDKRGIRREYLNSPLVMFDPSRKGNGRMVKTQIISYDKRNNLLIKQGSTGAIDYAYLHADGNSLSKFMAAPNGKNIGLFTLTDGKKLIIRLDYNGDAIIDHMEIYDAVYKRITHFVLENSQALQRYNEMLEGKNVFCMLGSRAGSSGSYSFGIGVPQNTIYKGCGKNGFLSGHGVPKFYTGPRFKNPADVIDNFCSGVLSGNDRLNGNESGGMVSQELKNRFETPKAKRLYEVAMGMSFEANNTSESAAPPIPNPPSTDPEIELTAPSITIRILGVTYRVLNDPINLPGDAPQAYWAGFCEQRTKARQCYSLNSLEKAMSHNDCNNPAAQTGSKFKSSGGKTSSPSGGPGKGGSSSTCPWQPYSPASSKIAYCQDKMQHPDLGSVWARINEERCNNPVAQPGPPGTNNCGTSTIGSSNAKLQVAGADIIAPGTTKFIDDLLDKVINPGVGLYNQNAYKNDIQKLKIRKF